MVSLEDWYRRLKFASVKWWKCSEEFSYRWKPTGTKSIRIMIKEAELDTEAEIKNYIHASEPLHCRR